MRAVKTIILANQREFTPTLDAYLLPHEREEFYQEDYDHESVCMFWGGDEKLLITSFPLDADFVADSCRIMNYHAVRTLSPSQHDQYLCDDIQNDPALFDELVQTIQESACPQILVWGASAAYYRLIHRLEGMGLSFLPAEVPPAQAAWTLDHFGSKAGFRMLVEDLAKKYPQIKIPEGIICDNLSDAFEKAQYFAQNNRPFLMKSSRGLAGWQIIIFNPASSLNNLSEHQLEKTRSGIWNSGPVVVEEYIDSGLRADMQTDRMPLIPTVNMLITPTGEVQFQFAGNMVIENGADYHGVGLGLGVLPAGMHEKLQEIGTIIGCALSENGYRGWFDVDLVANERQELFCIETNTRRTGPLHAFDIFTRLKTQHPQINTVISNDSWEIPNFEGYTYHEIKTTLREILYPIQGQPRGLILTIATVNHSVGFAILGQDLSDVMHIKHQAEKLVQQTQAQAAD